MSDIWKIISEFILMLMFFLAGMSIGKVVAKQEKREELERLIKRIYERRNRIVMNKFYVRSKNGRILYVEYIEANAFCNGYGHGGHRVRLNEAEGIGNTIEELCDAFVEMKDNEIIKFSDNIDEFNFEEKSGNNIYGLTLINNDTDTFLFAAEMKQGNKMHILWDKEKRTIKIDITKYGYKYVK